MLDTATNPDGLRGTTNELHGLLCGCVKDVAVLYSCAEQVMPDRILDRILIRIMSAKQMIVFVRLVKATVYTGLFDVLYTSSGVDEERKPCTVL